MIMNLWFNNFSKQAGKYLFTGFLLICKDVIAPGTGGAAPVILLIVNALLHLSSVFTLQNTQVHCLLLIIVKDKKSSDKVI